VPQQAQHVVLVRGVGIGGHREELPPADPGGAVPAGVSDNRPSPQSVVGERSVPPVRRNSDRVVVDALGTTLRQRSPRSGR
jgi:hypothetical protein